MKQSTMEGRRTMKQSTMEERTVETKYNGRKDSGNKVQWKEEGQ